MTNNPTDTQLEPCPFCGEGTCISVSVEHGQPKWFAFCPPCNAHGPWADSEDDARKAWNRRPTPSSTAQGVCDEPMVNKYGMNPYFPENPRCVQHGLPMEYVPPWKCTAPASPPSEPAVSADEYRYKPKMAPSQDERVHDNDVEGDIIMHPRSPWDYRHNSICRELLRLRGKGQNTTTHNQEYDK